MIIDEVLYERFWNGEKTAADEVGAQAWGYAGTVFEQLCEGYP